MASVSGSDNSDDTSSSELSEHNTDDDSENEKKRSVIEENKPCDSEDPESYDCEQNNSLKVPATYVPLQVRGGLALEHISDEDEIWMVQCPLSINAADLRGKNIIFGGSSEFAIKQKNGEKQLYETTSYTGASKPFACLLPTTKSRELVAKVVEPAGLIVIKEKICVPDLDDELLPKKRNFIIPEDLKIRHPLFGSDYKQELDARRTHFDDSVKKKKKKKKKKKHKTEDKSDMNHKRKRKTSDNETEYENLILKEEPSAETSEDCNSITHKRKKRKKSKNREIENVPNEEYVVEKQEEEEENVLKKKKKNKKKSRESVE